MTKPELFELLDPEHHALVFDWYNTNGDCLS